MSVMPYFNILFVTLVTVVHFIIITNGQHALDFPLGDIGLPPDYKNRQVRFERPTLPFPREPALPFSRSYDWRKKNVISPVRNQVLCNSCYAFASVGVLEAVIRIKYGESLSLDLAEQQPISCDRNSLGCGGGGMSVFSYWKANAPHREQCNDYKGYDVPCTTCADTPYRVSNWFTVEPSDVFSIKNYMLNMGPAYMSFYVHTPFFDYWRGYTGEVYRDSTAGLTVKGRHACQLIGWDDDRKAWLLQNGWGMNPPGPMQDGTIYMPYDSAHKLGYGFAFIEVEQSSFVRKNQTCWNNNRCCQIWAKTYSQCSKNSDWMNERCMAACGQCKPTFIYDLSCKDYHPKCSQWANNDQCSLNPGWMNMNCRASCKSCDLFSQSSLDLACML